MDIQALKTRLIPLLQKWWSTFLLLPFIGYFIHQVYRAFRFNIFFAISYDFPFPVNAVHFLLKNFSLIVHEAGHTFFSIMGSRFITILGGSLFEILLPLLIVAYAWYYGNKYGIQFSLFYLGFSLIDVAIYAADAGARQLPLIGGLSKESHDWYNMLNDLNILEADIVIGIIISVLGMTCYLIALFVPLFHKNYRSSEINLDI